jgi:AcrR family transcriptional regulator
MDRGSQIEGKKLEIVRWAFDRFYEGGFHATGIDAAMAGSGISKRTIYKYFSSKEDLIEAVLAYYDDGIAQRLFDPVASIRDPRKQIVAFFDAARGAGGRALMRGCLGMKAAQEYAGKHERIATLGRAAASRAEARFLDLCKQACFPEPMRLAKQLNVLFQGALVLSHVSGNTSAFLSAKPVVEAILDNAAKGGCREAARAKD